MAVDRTESLRRVACTGKTRHESFGDARRQLEKGKRVNKIGGSYPKMNIYLCAFCDGYHIGHKPNKVIKK